MELYAKGQLSFLILTCLKERDFYGLDIISEITNKSNGRISLKKPSVYSNLTRMEKQGYISSYLQSSDLGPNRKYYSLTESGRLFYSELKDYFDRNNVDVFRDFVDPDSPAQVQQTLVTETVSQEPMEDSTEKIEDNDFFDFSSVENEEKIQEETISEEKEVAADENKEGNDYQYIPVEKVENKESTFIETESAAAVGSTEEIDEYNKRLYDISKDINKFKRKRSFAEDQIAMTATAPLADSNEKSKANLEEFKNSFLENKEKYQSNQRLTNLDFSRYTNSNRAAEPEKKEEIKNDAVFITQRVDKSEIERPKRIEPPRFKPVVNEPVKETGLPAPKRDKTIDPSHKEILTKLYSKTKDGTDAEVREDAIYDYKDLKAYYNKQNIAFNEYKKPSEKLEHNTSKLYLWVSLITFGCAAILSGILYIILSQTGLSYSNTNFLYILLPALLVIDVVWKISNLNRHKRIMPTQILPQWQIWAIFLILAGLIVCINFICGMSGANFNYHATTTILPLVMILTLLPIRYYINRLLIVKYWK